MAVSHELDRGYNTFVYKYRHRFYMSVPEVPHKSVRAVRQASLSLCASGMFNGMHLC